MAALNILNVFSIVNKAYGVPGPGICINIDDNDRYRHDESESEYESSSSEDDVRAYQPTLLGESNELNYERFVTVHQPQGFEPNNIEEDLVYAEEALADKENNINVENIPSVESANNVVTPPPTGSLARPKKKKRRRSQKRKGFFGIQHNTLLEIFGIVKYMEMPAPQYLKSIDC